MRNSISRTINPLHFEELEPRRFEDLVRQLVYTFRDWHDLQATGRLGTDDGVDIRALERVLDLEIEVSPEAPEDDAVTPFREREWRIQCKRERRMGPAKVEHAVMEMISLSDVPHGVMLCAACDFSKTSRDRFRAILAGAGVEEFFLWGKAELEDRIFRPENDHLLWAYFGISLRVRRRSLRTEVRSRLALKKQLARVLGAPTEQKEKEAVFVRNVEAAGYPESEGDSGASNWCYFSFEGHVYPELLGFVTKKHFARWDREAKVYDYVESVDLSRPNLVELGIFEHTHSPAQSNARNFWNARVPPNERAIVKELSVIHYDQVIAVDDLGDAVHPGPHLLVDFEGRATPFRKSRLFIAEREFGEQEHVPLDDLRRERFFPEELPEVTWEEARDAWKTE